MNNRLDKYFSEYLDQFVFLELMPEYVKRERLDFMRNVPDADKKGTSQGTGRRGRNTISVFYRGNWSV